MNPEKSYIEPESIIREIGLWPSCENIAVVDGDIVRVDVSLAEQVAYGIDEYIGADRVGEAMWCWFDRYGGFVGFEHSRLFILYQYGGEFFKNWAWKCSYGAALIAAMKLLNRGFRLQPNDIEENVKQKYLRIISPFPPAKVELTPIPASRHLYRGWRIDDLNIVDAVLSTLYRKFVAIRTT